MSWILDCSIALAWCIEDEASQRTDMLLDRVATDPVVVPLHWPLEVTNVLRHSVRRNRLTEAQAQRQVETIMSLPVRYDNMTHHVAYTSTYRLARKHKLTSYDAAYLELAIRLGVALATNNQELIEAAKKSGVELL